MKIGVFDSGVGGITVLTRLREVLPGANFCYYGDNANLPYGAKSKATVEKLAVAAVQYFVDKKADLLVIACNTASALALDAIRKAMGSIPVLGVIEPGVRAVLRQLDSHSHPSQKDGGKPSSSEDSGLQFSPIVVMATRSTINSRVYGNALRGALDPVNAPGRLPCPIIEQACPLLVPMIEEGWTDHPILINTLEYYLGLHHRGHQPGTVLLGCTHYPWIHGAISQVMPGWHVLDSATEIGTLVLETLGKPQAVHASAHSQGPKGKTEWYFSDVEALPEFAKRMMTV